MRIACLAAVLTLATAPAAAAGLPEVQTHLRAVATMTADFSQTDQIGKTLTGTLSLKRPVRIRFQYEKGVPLLIVGDGTPFSYWKRIPIATSPKWRMSCRAGRRGGC